MQSHQEDALPMAKKGRSRSPRSLKKTRQKSWNISPFDDENDDGLPIESASNRLVRSPRRLKKTRRKPLNISPVDAEYDGGLSAESAPNQLVLYNPGTSNTGQDVLPIPDPTENHPLSFQNFSVHSRVLPSVGAFTVQCATCFKWRLIPTKEKYEEIRENILQEPFVCDRAREWRPDISCEDAADISQDGSRLWAIDKPNIAQPPPGWERLLRIRGEGSTKFADVYYAAPSGKKLRSMVDVQKYLFEHPEYITEGVNLSQFSFQIPKPLQENYVRKRPARVMNSYDGAALDLPRPLEPGKVNPLSWEGPGRCTDLQIGRSGSSIPYCEPSVHPLPIEPPPAKKKAIRPSSKQMYSSSMCNQPKGKVEDSQQVRDASSDEL